jgi:Zn-dependent protease with chaperone function
VNLLHQHFEAHAFLPELGNEVIHGRIVLSALALQFEAAETTVTIPMDRLVAEVRPGDEERITFTDRLQPQLEIFSIDLELLECTSLPALVRAREALVARLSGGELKRRLRLLGYCVLGCVLLTVLGSVTTSLMVRSIVNRIPPAWDVKYGASLIEELGSEQEFLKDTNAVARVTALAAPLLRVLPQTTNGYQFHLVQDEDPNAFALPGGHIVIHTGLLELADRPEELLGVVAHEVAHVTERHIYRKLISTAGPLMICRLFLSRGGLLDVMGGGAALLVGAGFSQEYETEADNVGWNYLVKANINPRGMAEMFRKLKQHDLAESGGNLMPDAFSSHPTLDKRIKHLEARWRKLPRKTGFLELPPTVSVKP